MVIFGREEHIGDFGSPIHSSLLVSPLPCTKGDLEDYLQPDVSFLMGRYS